MSSWISGASAVERPLGVDDRRELLDVDLDQVAGVLGDVAGARHHRRDDLADEAHAVHRDLRACAWLELGPVHRRHERPDDALEVGPGDHRRHAGKRRARATYRSSGSGRAPPGCARTPPRACAASEMSSMNWPWPAQEAAVLEPAQRPADVGAPDAVRARHAPSPASRSPSGGFPDRLDDAAVAGTAAHVARQVLADLPLVGIRVAPRAAPAPTAGIPACRSRTAARGARGRPAGSGAGRRPAPCPRPSRSTPRRPGPRA